MELCDGLDEGYMEISVVRLHIWKQTRVFRSPMKTLNGLYTLDTCKCHWTKPLYKRILDKVPCSRNQWHVLKVVLSGLKPASCRFQLEHDVFDMLQYSSLKEAKAMASLIILKDEFHRYIDTSRSPMEHSAVPNRSYERSLLLKICHRGRGPYVK